MKFFSTSRWRRLVIEPFNRLIENQQLMAYRYEGFWRAMDALRDRQLLEEMVAARERPLGAWVEIQWRRGCMKALQLTAPGAKLDAVPGCAFRRH